MKRVCLSFWSVALALTLPQLAFADNNIVVFGLTNVPIGQAILMGNVVTNVGSEGLDGVSILLGEADSGVFAYPDTTGSPTDGDYMLGRAYGKLNGVADQLLCTVRGHKVTQGSGFGIYPLTLDFSPLGVTNFLAQVFSRNGGLVAEHEIGLRQTIIRTDFNGYYITRVNPFWRTPDGAIAVVVEFPGSTGFQLPVNVDPHSEYPYIPFGTRLVLRALNPTGVVDFVSRVDVTTGVLPCEDNESHLSTFQMNEMRPGVFGRPHKALGDVALRARVGALTIARLNPEQPESENDFIEGTGVHVELGRASKALIDFQPVDLSGTNAQFGVTALVRPVGQVWYFSTWSLALGTARLRNTTNGLTLTGVFEPLGTNAQQVRLAVYRSGELIGMSSVIETNMFPLVSISGSTRILRAGAQANTIETPPGLGFTFDTVVAFSFANGAESLSLEGDEVKFLSVGPTYPEFPKVEMWIESVDAIIVNSRGLTDFTIIGEREEQLGSPRLSITRASDQVNLSWPDPNRAYYVHVSTNLLSPNVAAPYPDYTGPIATASALISTNEARFYWLIHSGVVD
jgi:hypothetical protein